MKNRSNVYIILVVFLLLIQPLISGCTTTVTKDVQKDDLFRVDLHKKDLVEEELHKEEVDLASQNFTMINVPAVMNCRTLTPILTLRNSGWPLSITCTMPRRPKGI